MHLAVRCGNECLPVSDTVDLTEDQFNQSRSSARHSTAEARLTHAIATTPQIGFATDRAAVLCAVCRIRERPSRTDAVPPASGPRPNADKSSRCGRKELNCLLGWPL